MQKSFNVNTIVKDDDNSKINNNKTFYFLRFMFEIYDVRCLCMRCLTELAFAFLANAFSFTENSCFIFSGKEFQI